MRALTVVLMIGLVTSAAAAPRRFALDALRVSGNVSAEERRLLDERVWNAVELLTSANDEIVHLEEVQQARAAHPEVADCQALRCWLRLGDLLSADRVLSVHIVRSGGAGRGDWSVRIEQVDVRAARALPESVLALRAVPADNVAGDLSHAIEKMLLSRSTSALCTAHISSAPSGGELALDGVVVGTTPFDHSIEAGHHQLTLTRAGSLPGQRELECPSDGEAQLNVTLVEAPRPRRVPALKIVGAVLLVAGVAGVGLGGYALARDGVGTCDLVAPQKRCPQVFDTAALGGALVGLGVAALVGGVVSLVVDARRRPARLDASLMLLPGGAGVVIGGAL